MISDKQDMQRNVLQMDESKEYLMLREEILHLSSLESQTLNFMYVFVGTVLAFSFTQEDTISILISYIVIIPAYNIIIDYEQGIYKIGAYLYVFLEGSSFNWERRSLTFYETLRKKEKYNSPIQAFNYPFIFISTLITVFFFVRTDYSSLTTPFGVIRLLVVVVLYIFLSR